MSCKTCKKKKSNTVTSLVTTDNTEDLKQAYEYVSIASQMDNKKWDFVEGVLNELYPMRKPLNRTCPPCLREAAKLVTHLYKKSANK